MSNNDTRRLNTVLRLFQILLLGVSTRFAFLSSSVTRCLNKTYEQTITAPKLQGEDISVTGYLSIYLYYVHVRVQYKTKQ